MIEPEDTIPPKRARGRFGRTPGRLLRRLVLWLEARSPGEVNSMALLLLILISALDYLTPPQLSTFVFYMAPIAIAAWSGGRASGVLIAIMAAGAWVAKDIVFRGVPYAEQWILFWNSAARLITFSVVALLIAEVRLRLRREQHLARTDALTGLPNARAFHEELALELVRARRANDAVSFVYLDLDHFKAVNDERGHAEGDRVLAAVAAVLRRELRRSDLLGRLGGDEFAVLLPRADPAETGTVVSKLHASLKEEMARQGWPVTFSIGAIMCPSPTVAAETLVHAADRLMYEVKAGGKDAVLYRVWPATGAAPAVPGVKDSPSPAAR